MEFVIIGLIIVAFALILKMVFESKMQIDELIQELEEIQQKIDYSLPENKKRRHQLNNQFQDMVLANGHPSSQTPYTSANQN